ncbi:MAG: redox-regulated ATPase YchF [Candidatus Palauibacterales bacterium]|nr:redox-regulated ATPase YchF [Candidatus Palauibacterales bacterium]
MSKLSIGIVGLPNVGKSTLFQALTSVSVPAENYPFCTIDPNVGVVEVPDRRLHILADLVRPPRVVPNVVEFVDIAGLVAGASQGEGLGNKFLQNIREVDAIAHVVRCFEDPSVVSTGDLDNPSADREVVELELELSDLEIVLRALDKSERRERSGDKDAAVFAAALRRIRDGLDQGVPARRVPLDAQEARLIRSLGLLTRKPVLYVANVDEHELEIGSPHTEKLRRTVERYDPEAEVVEVCARLEADLLALEPQERLEFLAEHGMTESGLARLIRAGFRLLGLRTFFTVGDNEVRAWTLRSGALAPHAAGRVHSDFERGFIRAETIAFDEFRIAGSMKVARERGLIRSEGKEYEVRDGDILLFRTSA